MTARKKIVVIGLDGSSWDLVKPLVDEGRLPNIKKMMEAGSHGMMQSTNPAHSAPAWTTFVTGVDPTQHGCFDFLTVDKNIDDLKLIDSTQIPQETIYETMVRHGRTPILINLPNTYPAKLKDNITITSLMTRGDAFIYPQNLIEKYPELEKYRLSPNPKLRMKDDFDPYVKDLCEIEKDRIAAAKKIFTSEKWDFFFYLSSGTDWVSHVVYDKAIEERYSPAIKMWEIMDEYIGWVMNNMDEDTNLIVMSDHGFKVYDKIFYVNRWLEENGYLKTQSGSGTFNQDHTKLSKEISKAQGKQKQFKVGKNIRNFIGKSKALEKVAKWIYFKIIKRFIPITVSLDLQLDILATKIAFPRGSMATMLYINDKERFSKGIVNNQEKQDLISKIQLELSELTDKSNNKFIKKVITKSALYGDEGVVNSPDLFLEPGEYYLSGSLHSSSIFENSKKNYHDDRGMLLAYGPDIKSERINDTHINNMAPTIMQAMRLPMQKHYVGKPIQFFKNESTLAHPTDNEEPIKHSEIDSLLSEIKI